ncbi:MAG: B12-binding domain-containing protein [Candidatus Hodarchaeota archaeon]
MAKDAILEKLRMAVERGDSEAAEAVAKEALEAEINPVEAIEQGLAVGIRHVGEQFEKRELYLPDLMLAARAMEFGMKPLIEEVQKQGLEVKYLGRVLLGTVEGDIHDIGKKLVATMLQAGGFEVIDLGFDVSTQTIVEKVKELKPDILGLSAMMTSTMLRQGDVIQALRREGLTNIKVIIGGASVSEEWAIEIGAAGYGPDAEEAVRMSRRLVGQL